MKVGRGTTKRNNKVIRTEVSGGEGGCRAGWRTEWRNPLLNLKKVSSFDWRR